MKTAKDFLEERQKLKHEDEQLRNKIKGQWVLIESKIDSAKVTKDMLYIDIGNVGLTNNYK